MPGPPGIPRTAPQVWATAGTGRMTAPGMSPSRHRSRRPIAIRAPGTTRLAWRSTTRRDCAGLDNEAVSAVEVTNVYPSAVFDVTPGPRDNRTRFEFNASGSSDLE